MTALVVLALLGVGVLAGLLTAAAWVAAGERAS